MNMMNTRICIFLHSLLVSQVASQTFLDCPSFLQLPDNKFIVFREDQAVGAVLFNYTWPNLGLKPVIRLSPDPSDSRNEGYLRLDEATREVILNRSLELNILNSERTVKIPQTDEPIPCNYTTPTPPQALKDSIIYNFQCEHSSGTLSKLIVVIIEEVNLHDPYFECSPYTTEINELALAGSRVFRMNGLGLDGDVFGSISAYSLVDDGGGMFILSGGATEGLIVLNGRLDYDFGTRLYSLNVSATDSVDPKRSNWTWVNVRVTDGDDQNPTFDQRQYNISFKEEDNSTFGLYLPTSPPVFAYDQDRGINATLAYRLTDGYMANGKVLFSIANDTGQVRLHQVLDRETIPSYTFEVQAYQIDNPLKRTAVAVVQVTVTDVNDNKPEMDQTQYTVSIPENMPAGFSLITVSGSDKDEGNNSVIEYAMTDTYNALSIEKNTGEIRVKNGAILDREVYPQLVLQVWAREKMTAETWESENATVRVDLTDVNDNNPIFYPTSLYSYDVDVSLDYNGTVGWVYANDTDQGENAVVRYSITHTAGPATGQLFKINETSGEISFFKSPTGIADGIYTLTVLATDQSLITSQRRSATAVVQLNLYRPTTAAPPTTQGSTAVSQNTTSNQISTTMVSGSPANTNSDALTSLLMSTSLSEVLASNGTALVGTVTVAETMTGTMTTDLSSEPDSSGDISVTGSSVTGTGGTSLDYSANTLAVTSVPINTSHGATGTLSPNVTGRLNSTSTSVSSSGNQPTAGNVASSESSVTGATTVTISTSGTNKAVSSVAASSSTGIREKTSGLTTTVVSTSSVRTTTDVSSSYTAFISTDSSSVQTTSISDTDRPTKDTPSGSGDRTTTDTLKTTAQSSKLSTDPGDTTTESSKLPINSMTTKTPGTTPARETVTSYTDSAQSQTTSVPYTCPPVGDTTLAANDSIAGTQIPGIHSQTLPLLLTGCILGLVILLLTSIIVILLIRHRPVPKHDKCSGSDLPGDSFFWRDQEPLLTETESPTPSPVTFINPLHSEAHAEQINADSVSVDTSIADTIVERQSQTTEPSQVVMRPKYAVVQRKNTSTSSVLSSDDSLSMGLRLDRESCVTANDGACAEPSSGSAAWKDSGVDLLDSIFGTPGAAAVNTTPQPEYRNIDPASDATDTDDSDVKIDVPDVRETPDPMRRKSLNEPWPSLSRVTRIKDVTFI